MMFSSYLNLRTLTYAGIGLLVVFAYVLGHVNGSAKVRLQEERIARATEQRVSQKEIEDVGELERENARIKELEQQLAVEAAGDSDASNVAIDADAVQRINRIGTNQN